MAEIDIGELQRRAGVEIQTRLLECGRDNDRLRMVLKRLYDFVSVSNDWRPDSKLARDVRAALDKK